MKPNAYTYSTTHFKELEFAFCKIVIVEPCSFTKGK